MIRHLCIFVLAASTVLLGGCDAPFWSTDAGAPVPFADASTGDDGGLLPDAGAPDGGTPEEDAGLPDAGAPDAGIPQPVGNGVWLTRNYVAYGSFYDPAVVGDLALRMSTQYRVANWFVNSDRVGADGRLLNPPPHINEFLDTLSQWETGHGIHFRVFAWVSGSTTGAAGMDLTRPEVRRAVVEECQRLLSPTVPGSYAATTSRPFDGVQIDFEPSGFDEVRFGALVTLMDELRAGLAEVGRSDALVSVAAHKLGTGSEYHWSPAFYSAMAPHVDVLASMTYNSGSATAADYQAWMRDQLQGVLRAVSGTAWSDGSHPPPSRPVEVLFGLPAYPGSSVHDPAAETVEAGAIGLHKGLSALEAAGDPSGKWMGGAAVYLHTRGIADDGYARWDAEWWWFGHDWLQRW